MHYRLSTWSLTQVKTACARNVPKSEATTSRMSVTCETCLRYIESIADMNRPVGNYESKAFAIVQDKEGNFKTYGTDLKVEEKGKGGSRG